MALDWFATCAADPLIGAAFRLGVRVPFGRSEPLQLLASSLRCRDGWRGRTGEVGRGFVRAQPDAITDSCSHAVADT